jgi:hypothetical protein
MNNKRIALILKSVIIMITLIGLTICIIWYPFSISLTTIGTVNSNITISQTIEFWIQLVFYWLASVPCFIVLFFSWLITDFIKADEVFSFKVANLLNKSSKTLLLDLLIFLVGNIIFVCLKWNDFALIYFFIALIGFCLVAITFIISHYVVEAANLREINEGTI